MNEICLSCRKHTKCGRAKVETIGCGYYVPQTNEEWLKSCNNKELANAIFSAFVESATMIGCSVTLEYFRTQIELMDALCEWLKQPHGGE